MIEEYRQIASAFFILKTQVNSTLKLYLTIISIASTAIISTLTLKSEIINNQSQLIAGYSIENIAGSGFIILALIGVTIVANMIGTRVQMLKYARTVNCIRGFFKDNFQDIEKYLRLPTTDRVPLFFEGASRAFFWYVLMLGLLNSVLILVGFNLIYGINNFSTLFNIIIMSTGLIFHITIYYLFCNTQDKNYSKNSY